MTLLQLKGVLKDTAYGYVRGETVPAIMEALGTRFGTTATEAWSLLVNHKSGESPSKNTRLKSAD